MVPGAVVSIPFLLSILPKESTLLHVAANEGFDKCVDALLEAGVDVNTVTTEGETALIIASKKGHTKCAALLLSGGADPNITENKQGNTALMCAT